MLKGVLDLRFGMTGYSLHMLPGYSFLKARLPGSSGRLVKHMYQGLNSHYFHIIGNGHQPNSRDLYNIYPL